MAVKRTRYTIKGNFRINDKDLKGVVVVDLGPCTGSGRVASDGTKILKCELTHRKFRFEDLKVATDLGLSKELATFTLEEKYIGVFLTKQKKETSE